MIHGVPGYLGLTNLPYSWPAVRLYRVWVFDLMVLGGFLGFTLDKCLIDLVIYHYYFITGFMVLLGHRNSFCFSVFLNLAMNLFWLLQEWNSVAKDEDLGDFPKIQFFRKWLSSLSNCLEGNILFWKVSHTLAVTILLWLYGCVYWRLRNSLRNRSEGKDCSFVIRKII